jgi:hypothetical protein
VNSYVKEYINMFPQRVEKNFLDKAWSLSSSKKGRLSLRFDFD